MRHSIGECQGERLAAASPEDVARRRALKALTLELLESAAR